MKTKHCAALVAALAVSGGVFAADDAPSLPSGLDTSLFDSKVRPQDDINAYANGLWARKTPIPADKPYVGSWTVLSDRSEERQIALLEAASTSDDAEIRKAGELYRSFMDEAHVESLGIAPLKEALEHIDAARSPGDIAALFGELGARGTGTPIDASIGQDEKNSSRYSLHLSQGGLGLPDRDYYLQNEARLKTARDAYQKHIATVLALAGDDGKSAAAAAKAIIDLETHLAKVQWTNVQNRDPIKTYNARTPAQLKALAGNFDWDRYFAAAELTGHVEFADVLQPSYLSAFNGIIKTTPVSTWKSYLRYHLISSHARYLSKAFVDENFNFLGGVLTGTKENETRAKRGAHLVDALMGEALGRAYVARYFTPEAKAQIEQLVANLIAAYKIDIKTLDWMGDATKQAAEEKLTKLNVKVGYPSRWRDYSALAIASDDLMGNVVRGELFEYRRNVAKLGQPIDRTEWGMSPQTVNAYYDSTMNEIVFPAAVLEPPFFDAKVDSAANYGAIGSIIGHEISHGYDDEGSQADADGNLRDWWTADDHKRFAAKTRALVAEYNRYEPIPGYKVNGALTLGENIADNAGNYIAMKAYQLSLDGKPSPVIDGMTGEQRFYLAWTVAWRSKMTENLALLLVKSDPHAPDSVRAVAVLANQPEFFKAFNVQPGDKMYRTPAQRILIW